ncbi:hypothetical protein F4775DRAFT_151364 [Biscogniauxia sp. FL1348]|nr:hypothetical protein F4775DRAFT_151364 [Biscogniauxia sp. FL1348]
MLLIVSSPVLIANGCIYVPTYPVYFPVPAVVVIAYVGQDIIVAACASGSPICYVFAIQGRPVLFFYRAFIALAYLGGKLEVC